LHRNNTIIQGKTRRRRLILPGVAVLVIFATAAAAGCGSSTDAQSGQNATSPALNVESRPSAGVVEAIDGMGDTVDPNGNPVSAPREVDITDASVSKDGQNLKFTMEVSGRLPNTRPADTGAAEWGFLLDTNGDGKPDWGVYAELPPGQNGWSYGLYNQSTKARQADKQFPGSFSRNGSTLTLTINQSAFGSPANFKWTAYSDDIAATAVARQAQQGGDHVPNDAWPLGKHWLDYP
jgi:hypothetical protein